MSTSPRHGSQDVADGIHIVHAFEYADASARTGASGLVSSDVGKVARQLDDDSFWILNDDSPVTWTRIDAASTGDVSGPVSSGDENIAVFDGTTGKVLKDSGEKVPQLLRVDGTRSMTGSLNMGSNNITSVGTVDGVDVSDHQARHILGGADAIDGDQLGIDYTPVNYVPSTSPSEVTNVDHLTAHLAGIDSVLGSVVQVRNESGSTLVKGKLAAITGFDVAENLPLVDLASKDDPGSRPALGFVQNDITNNNNGFVIVVGILRGVDTSAWTITDQLVLGDNGDPSRPPPEVDPFTGEIQNVGHVARVDATDGWIAVLMGGLQRRFPRGHIFGAELSLNATNPNFQVDVQRVECRSDDDLMDIVSGGTLTADLTASGANGLDTGSEATSTWYSVWVIADSSGVIAPAALLSTSVTSPTLPSGYDKKRRVGWVRNNASGNFLNFAQSGTEDNRVYLYIESLASTIVLFNGSATTPTAVSLAAFVPPTSNSTLINLGYNSASASGAAGIRATGTLAGVDHTLWPTLVRPGVATSDKHIRVSWTVVNASQSVDYEVTDGVLDITVQGFQDFL